MYGVRLGWAELPDRVTGFVAGVLGAPVVEAVSQPGGFSPGTADRVRAANGARAFVKAVSTAQNPDSPGLHRREIEVLRTLAGVAAVPQLVAAHDDAFHDVAARDVAARDVAARDVATRDDGEWVVLVIEDVEGRHPLLPWTDDELATTLRALVDLSRVTAPVAWPSLPEELEGEMRAWERLRETPPEDLDLWLRERADDLADLCARTRPRMAGTNVAHTDLRADNLLVQPDGRVRIVDWPWASRGAAWCDAAMLLVNVRWAGDLDVRPHLPAVLDLGATLEDVVGLVAGLTGFFNEAARRPPAPGLPTLRQFQREQAVAGAALLRELGI